jgi:hypothetical protein
MSEGSLLPGEWRGMTVVLDAVESVVVAPQEVRMTLPMARRNGNACFGRISLFISLLEFFWELKVAESYSRSSHAPSSEIVVSAPRHILALCMRWWRPPMPKSTGSTWSWMG